MFLFLNPCKDVLLAAAAPPLLLRLGNARPPHRWRKIRGKVIRM
jgi:hypothetical protein